MTVAGRPWRTQRRAKQALLWSRSQRRPPAWPPGHQSYEIHTSGAAIGGLPTHWLRCATQGHCNRPLLCRERGGGPGLCPPQGPVGGRDGAPGKGGGGSASQKQGRPSGGGLRAPGRLVFHARLFPGLDAASGLVITRKASVEAEESARSPRDSPPPEGPCALPSKRPGGRVVRAGEPGAEGAGEAAREVRRWAALLRPRGGSSGRRGRSGRAGLSGRRATM